MGTEPIPRDRLVTMLKGLALHDRSRSDWNGDQWQLLFQDYFEELGGFPEFKLDLAYQILRRRKQPFFPSIGEFLEAIEKGDREWMAGARAREAESFSRADRVWQHYQTGSAWPDAWGPPPTEAELAACRKAAGRVTTPDGTEVREQLDLTVKQSGDPA